MTNKRIYFTIRVLTFLFALFTFLGLSAQEEFPARPNPPRLVNDLAGIVPHQAIAPLEDKLDRFNEKTSTQIAIVTVKSLYGYDKADYAVRLAEKWGIGQKGKNNGILILIQPKTTAGRSGEIFIAVGYGLEGVIPDIVARQIIEAEIIPSFKQGDYFTGLDRGTNVLMSLTAGEFTADQYSKKVGKAKGGLGGLGLIIFFFVMIVIFSRGRSQYHSIGSSPGFWGSLFLMNMLGGSRGGSWDDFSGGRGDFVGGGSSGGGFGGFGGGSFGGGGAGGSW
jgi:uncharacterized protein